MSVVKLDPRFSPSSGPGFVVRLDRKFMPTQARPSVKVEGWCHTRGDGVETIWLPRGGDRIIEGIASTPTVNSHGYSLASDGCIATVPLPLLFSHGHVGDTRNQASSDVEALRIGTVFLVEKSARSIVVRAQVDHTLAGDAAWRLIQNGEALAFSGAAASDDTLRLRGVVDGHTYYDRWRLAEVSVCRRGANPDCTFEVLIP